MDPGSSPTALPETPSDPMVGVLIGDRYRLLGRIGEGGMGAVYRAEHVLMKKVVALKLLHAELGNVDDAARRFEREAQSASRLNHPNIIAVTDFGRAASGGLFLVMEYVAGDSLATLLERGRLPHARAVSIVRQILDGLEHAHGQGVIHRDLKPANIMLAAHPDPRLGEVVKILDFGIAKMLSAAGEGEAPLTQGAMVFGTPSYMSPEQATAQEADARADIYSCGVVLFEMLTGRKPFVSDDLVKVMAMQVTQAPPRLSAAAPDAHIPPGLETVVMRALEKDRANRFPSAAAFRGAVEEAEAETVRMLARRLPVLLDKWVAVLRREFSRLPWKVRRWVRPGAVALLVLAVLVLPLVCGRRAAPPTAPAARPPAPRPVEPALQAPIKRIEEAMAKGQLKEARLLLMQQISQHPANGRMRYLLGNLDFAERNAAAGLVAYEEAMRLEPSLRADAALLVNVRNLLADKKLGKQALELMTERIGRPAGATLAELATEDRRSEFRQAAREACKTVGCLDAVDLVKSYTLDLQQGRTCEARRLAVQGLGATRDSRIIEPLRKARRQTGGLLGEVFGGGNRCIRKDIDAILQELGVGPQERPDRQDR